MDYSLQGNRKTEEGNDHPDRDEQFRYINEQVRRALVAGRPVISVDTKKKELIGNFQNRGRQWRKKKSPLEVNGHDFPDPSVPRAYPYGIYDLARNTGVVNVGTDHDTGCLRRGFDSGVVACRRKAAVPERPAIADHGGWRRQQRMSLAVVEGGSAEVGKRNGAVYPGLPSSARDQQMEQGGTPVVFFHLLELAGRAPSGL